MLAAQIKTASDLKAFIESSGQEPYFFDRKTMKFFGDRMSNYGVRKPAPITTIGGATVLAYELYRRRPVKHGLQKSAWFDATTFAHVFPAND